MFINHQYPLTCLWASIYGNDTGRGGGEKLVKGEKKNENIMNIIINIIQCVMHGGIIVNLKTRRPHHQKSLYHNFSNVKKAFDLSLARGTGGYDANLQLR